MSNTVHIDSNAGPDLAAIINAVLADPDVSTVVLGSGIFLLNSPIFVPSDKILMGSGRYNTIIRASADFTIPNAQNNAVIMSEEQSTNITLSDFTVDAAKISPGGLRLNGIFMRFSSDFLVARIDVENATGYAHYAAGDLGSYLSGGTLGVPASGRYEDCNTFNSQVHFEQFFADGITLSNVHARDGDGDIPTEAYFHPIVGSRNITYEHSSAIGRGFLGFSLISSVIPLENISIIDTQIEILHPSQGSALISLGGLPVNGLYIEDSSFIAHEYIAFRIGGVSGTANNSYFQGGAFAMEVTTSGNGTPSQFVVNDSVALGVRDATSGFGVAGVHSDFASYLTWNGGSIEARAGLMFPVSGSATISATTQLIGAGHDVTISYTEGGDDLLLFAGADFGLSGTPNLNNATLQIRYLSHFSTSDSLALAPIGPVSLSGNDILYSGVVIGTVGGGTAGSALLITLNAAATLVMVEALLDNVCFQNLSDTPLTTARMMAAGLQVAGSSYTELTASLSIVGVDDAAIAMNDSGTVTESGTLSINVLANEADIDGVLDSVARVNGTALVSGGSVMLASGARVTLTADGQLLYDPNGVFSGLSAFNSNGNFKTANDSFSYTLSGGSSALVTIAIEGQTSAEDVVRGDPNANTLIAVLYGQTLKGQAGADTLDDNGLAATLNGGADNDTYRISNSATVLSEAIGGGTDQVRTSLSSFTLADNVENLYYIGSTSSFSGYGNAEANIIEGGGFGDLLIGYAGADSLIGGDGNDVLQGGKGSDQLTGGTGADQFRFDTSILRGDVDTITDFEFGVDQIQLSRAVFSALDLGALSATAFVNGAAAQDSDDRIIYDAATGSLYYDADGNGAGAAIKFASVTPQMPLDESAFVII